MSFFTHRNHPYPFASGPGGIRRAARFSPSWHRRPPLDSLADRKRIAQFHKVGLVVILATRWLSFMAEPMKAYDKMAFLPEIIFLASAIAFHYTIFRTASSVDKVYTPVIAKFAALVSLFLRIGIGAMGRAIGFV